MALDLGVAAQGAAAAATSESAIERMQTERTDLVDQYVQARPTGSPGWSLGSGIGLGAVLAGTGMGAVLLANRGKGAMYQGFNLMFGMPMALGAGGGIGYFVGSRLGEISTRPTGAAAKEQVKATRDALRQQISVVDEQLTAADGRRPQPLPQLDDSTHVSIGRIAGHAGAGLGIGMVAVAGAGSGAEALLGSSFRGGPSAAFSLLAPAAAAGAISFLNQRDEAAGRQGSLLRSAGIGAAALAGASLAPAFRPMPMLPRALGGAAIGAAVGASVHAVSVSSRD